MDFIDFILLIEKVHFRSSLQCFVINILVPLDVLKGQENTCDIKLIPYNSADKTRKTSSPNMYASLWFLRQNGH